MFYLQAVCLPDIHRTVFSGAFLNVDKSMDGVDLKTSSPVSHLTIVQWS